MAVSTVGHGALPTAAFAAVGLASTALLWWRDTARRSHHVWRARDVNAVWLRRVLGPLLARTGWVVRGYSVRPVGGPNCDVVDGYRPGYGGVGAVVELLVAPTSREARGAACGAAGALLTRPRVFVKFSQSQ